MCGLAGVASNDMTYKEVDAFKELLYISSLRGQDSTGVAVFSRKSDGDPFQCSTVKALGSSCNLIDSKSYDNVMHQTNKKILMGHTRAATRGNIRVSNAHPFEFQRIVGAHNGTLDYNTHRDLPFHNYFETDSEALISSINDHGITETLGGQEGAWALSLVNKDEGTISFVKNKERSLCYCFNEGKTALYWASEAIFLRFVLMHRDIKIHDDKVYGFVEDTLYTYDLPIKSNRFDTAEKTACKGRERVVQAQAWQPRNLHNQHQQSAQRVFDMRNKRQAEKETSRAVKLFVKHNVRRDEDENVSISKLPKFHEDFYEQVGKKKNKYYIFVGYQGRKWNQGLFQSITKTGCAFCGVVPEWGDDIVFCRSDAFTCQSCSGDDMIEAAIMEGDLAISCHGTDELNDALPTLN